MEEQILNMLADKLNIYVEDIQSVPDEEYAKSRKKTLGASDSAVYLGLNKYKTVPQLVEEKTNPELTEDEKAVKDIVSVRKGYDLEPLILKKFSEATEYEIVKPPHMYQHKEQQQLTVNFDGVIIEDGQLVPVEAKYVTNYGDKYYGKDPDIEAQKNIQIPTRSPNIIDHCTKVAEQIGIPNYYYCQVQQQLLFTGADHGYLVALSEKDWNLRIYYVKRDEWCISQICIESARLQARIDKLRNW